MNIVGAIEHAGEAVVGDVKKAITFTEKADHVVVTVIKDQPELKLALQTLISKGEAIVAEGVVVVGQKGLNFVSDETAVAEAEDFFRYFYSEVAPLIVKVYGEIKTDVEAPAKPAPTPAPAVSQAVPALHPASL